MSWLDDVAIISNSYKRYSSKSHIGHFVKRMGNWDGQTGYTAITSSLKFGTTYTPTSLVFVTTTEFRAETVTLTVNYKTCKRQTNTDGSEIYTTRVVNGATLKTPTYEDDTTGSAVITINAHERVGTSIRIGTSSTIYEITSVTSTPTSIGVTGTIYALASVGSKMIFGIAFNRLMRDLDDVTRGVWASPPTCPTCNGTGVINTDEVCPQCNGYKYSGREAVKFLLDRKAEEVGVGKDDSETVEKYQDRIWMQKWWVTPQISEIKRAFAHFANLASSNEVIVVERYDNYEPAWQLMLPTKLGVGSHFDSGDATDTATLERFMQSVEPVGTVSYLTWYSNDFGNTEWGDGWGQELGGSGWNGGWNATESHLWGGWGAYWGDAGFPLLSAQINLNEYAPGTMPLLSGMLSSGQVGYDVDPFGYSGYWYTSNSGYEFPYGT